MELIYDFSDTSPQFEKDCICTILAKVTMGISMMDVSELGESDVDILERLSATAISLVDEIKYLESIETNGFKNNESEG